MNPQSTDRLPIDADQDVPRIIFRKQFTAVTSTTGSGYTEVESTVTAPGIIIGAYNNYDLAIKRLDNSIVYPPIRTYTSACADDFWADIWLDSSDMANASSTATYRYKIRKYGGASTDSYTCWLIVWSTKINNYLNLFDTSY